MTELVVYIHKPGKNDGQMTMAYHGLLWYSMVIPCFVKLSTMVYIYGPRPWLTIGIPRWSTNET